MAFQFIHSSYQSLALPVRSGERGVACPERRFQVAHLPLQACEVVAVFQRWWFGPRRLRAPGPESTRGSRLRQMRRIAAERHNERRLAAAAERVAQHGSEDAVSVRDVPSGRVLVQRNDYSFEIMQREIDVPRLSAVVGHFAVAADVEALGSGEVDQVQFRDDSLLSLWVPDARGVAAAAHEINRKDEVRPRRRVVSGGGADLPASGTEEEKMQCGLFAVRVVIR
mmetsp:Transcript_2865/g.8489  ORF Transcript_2865/g.8489 Transcript_2865/m.8489 type:complete len:225 (-) Transcript_2865:647-1321(-)